MSYTGSISMPINVNWSGSRHTPAEKPVDPRIFEPDAPTRRRRAWNGKSGHFIVEGRGLMTVAEVMEMIGCVRSTIYNACRASGTGKVGGLTIRYATDAECGGSSLAREVKR